MVVKHHPGWNVNCWHMTRNAAGFRRNRTDRGLGVVSAVTLQAATLEQIPLARSGTIDEVVHAVMFLCSPGCGYVTGQVLHVNGGLLMP